MALVISQTEVESAAKRSACVSRLSKLAPFHPTAMRLLTISTESGSALSDFERVFLSDPALAADLLRVANSPLYGLRSRVDSVRYAIARLGLDMVRSLGFTAGMRAYMRGSFATGAVHAVWAHSVATAVVAEALGRASGRETQPLYTAALLHDVGRLGMLNIDAESYGLVLAREYYEIEESLLLENMLFGCAHTEAGAFLSRAWGFPDTLCDCIRFHHQAAPPDAAPLFQWVQAACCFASALGFGTIRCLTSSATPAQFLPDALRGKAALDPDLLRDRVECTVEALTGKRSQPS